MDKSSTRKALVEARLNMPDRLERADLLQRVMRIWLVGRPDEVIGAYWPIKGEFDPLPALYRWQEDAILSQDLSSNPALVQVERAQLATESIASRSPRKIGLPGRAATGWATAVVFMTAHWPRCSPGRLPWGWVTRRAGCRILNPSRMTWRWMRF